MHRLASRVELAFWLALALIAFGLSFQFSGEAGTFQWGAASWPRAVILLMVIAALINAWRARPALPGHAHRHSRRVSRRRAIDFGPVATPRMPELRERQNSSFVHTHR